VGLPPSSCPGPPLVVPALPSLPPLVLPPLLPPPPLLDAWPELLLPFSKPVASEVASFEFGEMRGEDDDPPHCVVASRTATQPSTRMKRPSNPIVIDSGPRVESPTASYGQKMIA
jgi:hypothetical protein